jgi:hypothetical protein
LLRDVTRSILATRHMSSGSPVPLYYCIFPLLLYNSSIT